MDSLCGNGVHHQEWARRGVILSWKYVVRPVCPFTAPEGTPEEVAVNSLPGRFWASPETVPEVPNGPDGSTAEISGVTITSGVSTGDDTTSTLMWEDPETGAAFCLRGELEKSDLLRMAESVEGKTRP